MRGKLNFAIICVFLWAGFVGAISFMEAWLKFRAPGITLPLGLGIGRLVFSALNKMEWIFGFGLLATIIYYRQIKYWFNKWLFILPFIVLMVHTFWLLPALDARAELIINGHDVLQSNLHIYYVCTELIKVTSLIFLGVKLLRQN